MKYYRLAHSQFPGNFVVWDNVDDMVNEVKMHLTEGQLGDEVYVSIIEMSDEEFASLEEFKGY
jgi:hypothetical protein